MAHLGTLEGTGTLYCDGQESGDVEYEIDVFQNANVKEAAGFLDGDIAMLTRAIAKAHQTLRLANGIEMGIVITKVYGARAEIKSTGPVPGY